MKAIKEIQYVQDGNNLKRYTERVRLLEAKVSVVLEETVGFASTEAMEKAEFAARLATI